MRARRGATRDRSSSMVLKSGDNHPCFVCGEDSWRRCAGNDRLAPYSIAHPRGAYFCREHLTIVQRSINGNPNTPEYVCFEHFNAYREHPEWVGEVTEVTDFPY